MNLKTISFCHTRTFAFIIIISFVLMPSLSFSETHHQYHANGAVSAKWTTNDQGKYVGFAYTYYDTGQPATIIPYVDGKKHGEAKHFYPSGNIELQHAFVDDNIDGVQFRYYENGFVRTKAHFSKGVYDGDITDYYENGTIQMNTPWVQGKIHGDMIEYHKSDPGQEPQIAKIIPHVHGEVKGEVISFYANGANYQKTNYNGQVPLGSAFKYYDNGRESEVTEFKKGKVVKTMGYYPDGRLSSLAHYNNDEKLHGKQQHFYKNAQLSIEKNWNNGVQMGDAISFDEQGFQIVPKEANE